MAGGKRALAHTRLGAAYASPASAASRAWLQAARPYCRRRRAFPACHCFRFPCDFSFFLNFLEPFLSSATVFQKIKEKQKTECNKHQKWPLVMAQASPSALLTNGL